MHHIYKADICAGLILHLLSGLFEGLSLNASPALQKEMWGALTPHERRDMGPYFPLVLRVAHVDHPCRVHHVFPSAVRQCGTADIRQTGGFLPRQPQY